MWKWKFDLFENVTSLYKGRLIKHFIKHFSSWDYHCQLCTKTRKFCGFVIQELQMIFKCNSAIFLTSSKCNLHVGTIWTHIIICRFLNYHVVHKRRHFSEQLRRQFRSKNERNDCWITVHLSKLNQPWALKDFYL